MSGQRPGSGNAPAADPQTTPEPTPTPTPTPTSTTHPAPASPPPGSGVPRGLNGMGAAAGSGGAVTAMANGSQSEGPPSAWTAPVASPVVRNGGEAQPASWALPGEPASAARARRLTRETMPAWGAGDDDVEDVVLMVDELVTNAVVHGRGPVTLLLRVEGGVLTGEVSDCASTLPDLAGGGEGDWGRESGRGLWLVSMLATDHGVRPEAGGKTLWFTRLLKH